MTMELNSLSRPKGLMKSRRVGRGGKRGKTSGRGGKGQTARAGNKRRPEWRDIIKKLPKRRGYGRNRSRTAVPRVPFAAVPLARLEKLFKPGALITPKTLFDKKVIRKVSGKFPPVKILGGEVGMALNFEKVSVSASAKAAVEKAGGKVASAS
jgi:large subunit ribosomal protein L15